MTSSRKTTPDPITGNFSRREFQLLASSIPTNLPALRGKLIGRDVEMRTICAMLKRDDVRLVTLAGFGGAGKTTLALHCAHAMIESFPGGLFFIDLTTINEPAFILPTIAKTLGVQEEPHRKIEETLRDFLANRSILFVLDNFEHLVEGASIVSDILNVNPLVHVLVTSREALRLRGEQVLPVAPLENSDSMQVFAQYAQMLNPHFRLTEDNTPAIIELCKKLDGLPLAIELAAMRTRMFTPQALLARLQSDLEAGSPLLATLTSGPRDMPERQQTMRATIAWSYSLLNETEQRAFRAASLFQGGFSLDGLRTVAGLGEAEGLEILSSLVDKSLVRSRESDFGVPWFSMLDTIREFAAEQVNANGEVSRFTHAFVDYFVEFSMRAVSGLKSDAQADWFRRMDVNQPNLLLAVKSSLSAQAGSIFWRSGFIILEQLHVYWMLSNNFQMGVLAVQHGRTEIEKYVASLKKKDRLSLGVLGNMVALSGSIAWAQGDYEKARDWHAAAYKIYEELKDESGMMNALNNWSVNLMALGNYDAALENYDKSLLLCRKLGDRWEEMRQLNNMAGCLMTLGRIDEAQQLFERGLSIARETGDQYFTSAFFLNIGDLQICLKKYHEAIRNIEQSLELSTPLDSFYIITWARVRMATAYSRLGRMETAISTLKDTYPSLECFFDADLKRLTIETLISIYSHQNRNDHAAILLGFFQEYLKRSKFILSQSEMEFFEGLEKNVSRHFSGEQFESRRVRGAAMSVKEALDFGMAELEPSVQTRKKEVDLFTVREREVLLLLAKGRSNEEISRELVVVLKTVEKHVANILRKLGVKNRTEAAAWTVENGIK